MNDHPTTHDEAATDAGEVYTATVTDTISRRQIGTFSFFATSIEDARQRGWRIAGQRYCPDIHVRIHRASH
jgi:hypothetical protein